MFDMLMSKQLLGQGDVPAITFAKCLTNEQKSHLKRKMENELADLMGEKSTDGASRIVDDMFKEFLAEKMALIEAEKRKVCFLRFICENHLVQHAADCIVRSESLLLFQASEGGEESADSNSSQDEAEDDPVSAQDIFELLSKAASVCFNREAVWTGTIMCCTQLSETKRHIPLPCWTFLAFGRVITYSFCASSAYPQCLSSLEVA